MIIIWGANHPYSAAENRTFEGRGYNLQVVKLQARIAKTTLAASHIDPYDQGALSEIKSD